MVHIALLLLIYVTAPPFGPRLTTTKLGEDHFRTTGQIPENPGPRERVERVGACVDRPYCIAYTEKNYRRSCSITIHTVWSAVKHKGN